MLYCKKSPSNDMYSSVILRHFAFMEDEFVLDVHI